MPTNTDAIREDLHPALFNDKQPANPPFAAVNTANPSLSPEKSDSNIKYELGEVDKTAPSATDAGTNSMTSAIGNGKEDSSIASVETPTQAKVMSNEGRAPQETEDGSKEDSFVEQIQSRTPGKRISRIADSIEALDAFEEEIEKVGELIPATSDELQLPSKTEKQRANTQRDKIDPWPRDSLPLRRATYCSIKADSKQTTKAVKPATTKRLVSTAASRSYRSKRNPEASMEESGSDNQRGDQQPQAVPRKRVSSIHKAPFQPAKSTKLPTIAAFELPGDAVSRKLKTQREERMKRGEKPKRPAFKARPVRLSQAPEVKLTATTKARLSMARSERTDGGGNMSGVPKADTTSRRSMATAGANNRSVAKRSSLPALKGSTQVPADSSVRISRGPSLTASTMKRAPSVSGGPRPAPTAEDLAHQKLKGKEVFGRTRVEILEREKAKKEKEDAARKARAEAAERGRLASREWAEKQKLRKTEAEKAKGEAT